MHDYRLVGGLLPDGLYEGERAFWSECSCGWKSPWELGESDALRYGARHSAQKKLETMPGPQPGEETDNRIPDYIRWHIYLAWANHGTDRQTFLDEVYQVIGGEPDIDDWHRCYCEVRHDHVSDL